MNRQEFIELRHKEYDLSGALYYAVIDQFWDDMGELLDKTDPF